MAVHAKQDGIFQYLLDNNWVKNDDHLEFLLHNTKFMGDLMIATGESYTSPYFSKRSLTERKCQRVQDLTSSSSDRSAGIIGLGVRSGTTGSRQRTRSNIPATILRGFLTRRESSLSSQVTAAHADVLLRRCGYGGSPRGSSERNSLVLSKPHLRLAPLDQSMLFNEDQAAFGTEIFPGLVKVRGPSFITFQRQTDALQQSFLSDDLSLENIAATPRQWRGALILISTLFGRSISRFVVLT